MITDARALDDARMQAIANEFGYAETTFVLPPRRADTTAHVRIFTPLTEVPFAGHPNVGTAFVLSSGSSDLELAVSDTMVFDEASGPVSVDVVREKGAETTAPQALDRLGTCDTGRIARCIGRTGVCVCGIGVSGAGAPSFSR